MTKLLDWESTLGETVRIYRNLNNGKMSIQTYIKGRGWIVAGHVTDCVVANVSFKVCESRRLRGIQDRQKNVHAWGQGILIAQSKPKLDAPVDLAYDPYFNNSFVERHSQAEISSCCFLVVRDNLVFVSADALRSPAPAPAPRKQKVRATQINLELPLFYQFAVA
ncbi:hypothetical protein H6G00_01915 [Leptolyngbya sp. FACHB-541]|uniref:hypothetical protein n=1 Tax=Leptolyngbya sp. FACHB-541 TaxID=2692810 RepID=UPI001686D3E3|nr:hypothetical protein [Leptolyngbya sp. FACHB-541]MBD1995388.1 hypothetical protein [Leptolyngbya sp. FACHB-541]